MCMLQCVYIFCACFLVCVCVCVFTRACVCSCVGVWAWVHVFRIRVTFEMAVTEKHSVKHFLIMFGLREVMERLSTVPQDRFTTTGHLAS